jgi:hypothetical protein
VSAGVWTGTNPSERGWSGRPPPSSKRWSWAVVGVDPGGRVRLPPPARRALGAETGGVIARAAARGAVLVVQESGDGAGVQVAVDGRGRMSLPEWWRRACAGGACAVATRAGTGEAVGDAAGGRVRWWCWRRPGYLTGWRTCWWGSGGDRPGVAGPGAAGRGRGVGRHDRGLGRGRRRGLANSAGRGSEGGGVRGVGGSDVHAGYRGHLPVLLAPGDRPLRGSVGHRGRGGGVPGGGGRRGGPGPAPPARL